MFLKNESFEHNGQAVTLYELSALQRIEHLEYLKQLEAVDESDIQKAMELTIRSGAMLVAMSLWHQHDLKGTKSDAKKEVSLITEEVLEAWPLEAIALAEFRVKKLSGMIMPEADQGSSAVETAEPVTAEKSGPAS